MTAPDERWIAGLATGLTLIIALAGHLLQRPGPIEPLRRDPATATGWMADCLPGVGMKRRATATEAIRTGDLAKLPSQAREPASHLFALPNDTAIGEQP